MLHALKVALLLLLTLGVMRGASWGIGWGLARATRTTSRWVLLAANAAALAAFVLFLWWNLLPGEPFDYAALAFGVVVYGACFAADLRWLPWRSPSS